MKKGPSLTSSMRPDNEMYIRHEWKKFGLHAMAPYDGFQWEESETVLKQNQGKNSTSRIDLVLFG